MEILQRDTVRLKIHANLSTNCRLVRVNLEPVPVQSVPEIYSILSVIVRCGQSEQLNAAETEEPTAASSIRYQLLEIEQRT